MAVDARHVVRRLAELRDWAEYVHESLMTDQPYEDGKLRRLSELANAEELRTIQAASYFLSRRLSALLARVAIESAKTAAP